MTVQQNFESVLVHKEHVSRNKNDNYYVRSKGEGKRYEDFSTPLLGLLYSINFFFHLFTHAVVFYSTSRLTENTCFVHTQVLTRYVVEQCEISGETDRPRERERVCVCVCTSFNANAMSQAQFIAQGLQAFLVAGDVYRRGIYIYIYLYESK